MTQSRNTLAFAALASLGLGLVTLAVAPSDGSARGTHMDHDATAVRIAEGFAISAGIEADPALEAAAGRLAKGDLGRAVSCGDADWPEIPAGCLGPADRAAPAGVRTVTIEYGPTSGTTVLMRIPAPQVVSR